MNIIEIIEKKKRGEALAKEEIGFFIDGCVGGTVPDYQLSALLMAIWFQGMDLRETFELTMAMKNSGDVLDLSFAGQTIDKHSTGGIGDKLSLIVLPIWLAGGLTVAKMSGRGLGFTGGTIDKLESVPGFDTSLSRSEFFDHVRKHRIAVSGQSASLVPADKKLYALRDVTATVDSLPLIAASIMSKKLAVAANTIVLDVKYGRGSFMKTKEQGRKLAEIMVALGRRDHRHTAAILSPMDQPLGHAVGNAWEVKEAFDFLNGKIGGTLKENALALGAAGFYSCGKTSDLKAGIALCRELVQSGEAAAAFLDWLSSQGGSFSPDDFYAALPLSEPAAVITADSDGFVTDIDALEIGLAAAELGAGRRFLEDIIDPGAGVVLKKVMGQKVSCGETLAVLYGKENIKEAKDRVVPSIHLGLTPNSKAAETKIEIYNGEKWQCLTTV